MSIIEFLKKWVDMNRDPQERHNYFNVLDIKQQNNQDLIIESIVFREEHERQLFMFFNKIINDIYTETYYSKLVDGTDFMCLSQKSGEKVVHTVKTEQEVLKHVRNSFWYIKNR